MHGSANLFRLELSSGRYERLTTDPTDEFEARLPPDEGNLLYSVVESVNSDLMVVDRAW